MTTLVHTTIRSIILIALFFAVASLHQSCDNQKKKADNDADRRENLQQTSDDSSIDMDEYLDEDPEEAVFDSEPEASATPDYTAAPSTSVSTPRTSSTSYSDDAPSYSSSSGQPYIVVSGNYLVENNADIMIKKLRQAGYDNAEKVVFDLSQYYTVLAGRYNTRAMADSASGKLKGKGIESYVLRKK